MPSMPSSAHLPAITSAQLALHYTRFANWFPLYRRHSPKATIIDLLALQPDFVDWLQEDGIVLPRDSEDEQYVDSDKSDDEASDDQEEEVEGRNFDILNERIRQVLSTYEGAVFPKLDWSAPLDAAWIVPGSTLRCTTPSDVYLLLKSSDFVSKDVKQLRELEVMEEPPSDQSNSTITSHTNIRPVLVLKKYFTIPTSHEFRCFVRAGRLICISQRDTGTFFDHLQEQSMQLQIRRLLQRFYNEVLSPVQQQNESNLQLRRTPFPITDFVWDAYISRDLSRVFLVDVNPFLERTDALLWTWSEVEEIAERWFRDEEASDDEADGSDDEEDETVMRIFTDGREPILIRPNGRTPIPRPPRVLLPHLRTITSRAQTTQSFPTYTRNMVPSEVVGAAEGNSIADFAREWNRQIAQSTVEEVDGDDEPAMHVPGR